MTEKDELRFRILGAAIVALVAFAAFAPALRTGFVYDDYTVVTENTELPSLFKANNYFTLDYFRLSGETTYRPMVTASYVLDYRFWGKNPFGYHLTNLLWHVAACVFFFLLCGSLRAPRELSLVAALIYATHPARSEGVVGIGFREDLLCAVFYLAALALWPAQHWTHRGGAERGVSRPAAATKSKTKRSRTRPDSKPAPRRGRASFSDAGGSQWLRFSGAILLYAMALLSKEMALSFPLLALGKELRLRRLAANASKERFDWKPLAIRQAVAWSVALAALGLYVAFTAPNAPATTTGDDRGVLVRLSAFLPVSLRYIRLFLVPYPLCIEYVVKMQGGLFWSSVAGAACVVLLLAVLALRLYRRFPAAVESLVVFYVLLAPVSNLIHIFNPMAERYLTLPVVAFAWLAAHLLALIPRRAVRWVATLILIAQCLALSWVRIADWRDVTRLWLGAINGGNATSRTMNNLGRELYQTGRPDEALKWYYRAIEMDPDYAEARINIGAVLYDKEKYQEAVDNYTVALRHYPNPRVGDVIPAMLHNNIANALYRAGELEKAYGHYEEALKILPRMKEPYNNRGSILATLGRAQEAVEQYKKAIENDIYWDVPRRNLAITYGRLGRLDNALEQYDMALKINPKYLDARLDRAHLLAEMGRAKEAIEEYRRVLQLVPNHPGATAELTRLHASPAEAVK